MKHKRRRQLCRFCLPIQLAYRAAAQGPNILRLRALLMTTLRDTGIARSTNSWRFPDKPEAQNRSQAAVTDICRALRPNHVTVGLWLLPANRRTVVDG
jgi:hypothetical protein